ncbi:MAG: hypothetical protein ACUVV0_08215 [Anaerolineae bacterium]
MKSDKMSEDVANPGSALGEAIGALLEKEIHRILKPLAEENGCIYVTAGPVNPKTGKVTKLILTDGDGNEYNIDSVIINNRFQPLVLVESKYIRYKKHNRDKASWVCTAHTKLRQRYSTVRKSIAVLMGSWSKPSKRLLRSFEVELFVMSFPYTRLITAGRRKIDGRQWKAGESFVSFLSKTVNVLRRNL